MSTTPFYPFVPRTNRTAITKEPDAAGRWSSAFPDMIGPGQQGGGAVPSDVRWPTNPKQHQEELTDAELRQTAERHHALPAAIEPLALPPGQRGGEGM